MDELDGSRSGGHFAQAAGHKFQFYKETSDKDRYQISILCPSE